MTTTKKGGPPNANAPNTASPAAAREKKRRESGASGNRRFGPERRGQLLGHLEAGETLEEACIAVGVSTATVRRWQKKARKDPDSEAGEFAQALDAARAAGQKPSKRLNLTQDDLIALLEERAQDRKCLKSIELLLTRPWERQDGDRNEKAAEPPVRAPLDELAARRAA